jgi:hypothetical protein
MAGTLDQSAVWRCLDRGGVGVLDHNRNLLDAGRVLTGGCP